MATVLKANPREDLRGSATKKIRKQGQVPAVLYGNKIDSQPVSVDGAEFLKTVRSVGKNGLFSLDVSGEKNHQVMIHDLQIDPLKNEYQHIDFFEVDMTSEIEASVPVHLTGEAPGEKEGGMVSHLLYEITVKCLPADIPEEITVDISNLNVGDSIQIADIRNSVSAQVTNDDDETIVTVQIQAAEQENGQAGEEEVSGSEAAEETEEKPAEE
ncbi:50S ribosomal protein L25/general stress protein Ctc [Halalkalibacter akibai]|uniref:Large ribosomal subunit protein bL25 n=1 Tax=Halalkalibacter akibai (strain ATCC 43226 / DSM 21942 / CIP 109018 / JCM 9157 / 1139) TaxID=1236973 RepID=W4QY44_HALA3|nr:50S ribosomal protein L25/general stress protein Ctc [Halalkalibacter akibai]GAE36568.1 LSU ribosomal protein L25p [Halalkalibacter akibai JCM 9157]